MRAFSFSLAGCLLLVSAEGRGNDLIFGSRFTRNDMIREPFSWRELLGFRKQSTSTCQQLLLCDSIRGGDGDGGLKQVSDLEEVEALVQHENHKDGNLIVLEFLAEDCDECRRMESILPEWLRSQPSSEPRQDGRVILVRINLKNADDDAIAINYQVTKGPAYIFIKEGEVQLELVGANVAEATLVDWIQLLTPKQSPTGSQMNTHEDEED